jgi:hypothetical protein
MMNPMPTIDIEEISKRAFKGDEGAQKKLMELAEDAHNFGNFEFSSECYREAALVFKWRRYRTKTDHEGAVSELSWSQSKLGMYEEYSKKQQYPVREYNHSFSSKYVVETLFPMFWEIFSEKYAIPFGYFEEVYEPYGSLFRSEFYLAYIIASELGFPNSSARYILGQIPYFKIHVVLDAIIPDFLEWAEKIQRTETCP